MKTIVIEKDERGVAVLALARAEKHNAMSAEMIAELTAAAAELGADPDVRVVVLTGTGASFCAGGDLGWMKAQMEADDKTRAKQARALAMMLHALDTLPKPLIGHVQGNAFGGGVGLMSVCDIALASDSARFGLTETRLGLIPATIGPYVISRMGQANARRVMMSGRLFSAAEAVQLGLLARALPAGQLDEAVAAQVSDYLKCAPGAVTDAKALIRRLGPTIDAATIDASIEALIARWQDQEAREGISAFFDKRKPDWES